MKLLICRGCGRRLGNPEIALNLKLRGRGIGGFFCENCLSEQTGSTVAELREIIRFFTENGCELFSVHYVDEECEAWNNGSL